MTFELLVSSVRDAIIDSENPFRPELQLVGVAVVGRLLVPDPMTYMNMHAIIEKPFLYDETYED